MYKKILILSAMFIASLILTSLFLSVRQQKPAFAPELATTTPSWKGIVPGAGAQELEKAAGSPLSVSSDATGTIYSYPSSNQYWRNSVTINNGVVSFINEMLFSQDERSLKNRSAGLKNPVVLMGPDSQSNILLFAYPDQGVAFLARKDVDIVYEVWYFPKTSFYQFMRLPQTQSYKISTLP